MQLGYLYTPRYLLGLKKHIEICMLLAFCLSSEWFEERVCTAARVSVPTDSWRLHSTMHHRRHQGINMDCVRRRYMFLCYCAPLGMPACLYVCLPACLPACLPVCLPACLPQTQWLLTLHSAQERYRDTLRAPPSGGGGDPSRGSSLTSFLDTAPFLLTTPPTRALSVTPHRRPMGASGAAGDSTERSQSDVGLATTTTSLLQPLIPKSSASPGVARRRRCDVTVAIDNDALTISSNDVTASAAIFKSDGSGNQTRQFLTLPGQFSNGAGGYAGAAGECDDGRAGGCEAGGEEGGARPHSPRSASLHAKRRSMLKAIREKSLSIDVQPASVVSVTLATGTK